MVKIIIDSGSDITEKEKNRKKEKNEKIKIIKIENKTILFFNNII